MLSALDQDDDLIIVPFHHLLSIFSDSTGKGFAVQKCEGSRFRDCLRVNADVETLKTVYQAVARGADVNLVKYSGTDPEELKSWPVKIVTPKR